jgi:predicted NBD/HSP70 family sugar kinase
VVERPETDPRRSGPGRPATGLALAAPVGAVGVIALSHVAIRAAVVGFDGRVLARREDRLPPADSERPVLESGQRLLAEAAEGSSLSCVVLGIPAPFEQGVGVATAAIPAGLHEVAPAPSSALRWFGVDPTPAVSAALGVPVITDNDANLGALGEATFGAGQGIASFVYVKVAEGLGAGLVLNGQLYRGARGLAGELAHVQVVDDGPWCMCGGRGCLAHAFGGFLTPFIEAAYRRPFGFAEVRGFAELGEAGTHRIVTDAGRRVGRVLADACTVLCPEAIIVDGMLGAAGPSFAGGIREMIDRHTSTAVAQTVKVINGTLGDQAELLGAAALTRLER